MNQSLKEKKTLGGFTQTMCESWTWTGLYVMVSLSQTCCDENKTFVFERVNHMDSFYTLRYVMNNSGIFSYKIFKGFDPVKHGKNH